mmetsp:Transcript_130835/g.291910  ORF Transcript_130835/g.291910 Transcript_130835/m.291910 type:complete len:531 (-) Transcript_130835:100-1692(-)
MDGDAASPKGTVEDIGVTIEKSYEEIYQRKEARLARDALRERRATHLTKHFLKLREREDEEKIKKEHEKSVRDYERNQHKLKEAEEAQGLVQRMVRDEKSQIYELMQDKGRQRIDEESQERAKREEQAKWIKARGAYEKIWAEKRQEAIQQKENERLAQIEERKNRHEEVLKEVLDAQAEKDKEASLKKTTDLEKIHERRKKNFMELRQAKMESDNSREQKASQAEKLRHQRHEEVVQHARDAQQKRMQKVQESRKQQQQELEEKCRQLKEKVERSHERQERSQQLQGESQHRQLRSEQSSVLDAQAQAAPVSGAQRTARQSPGEQREQESEVKREERKAVSPRITHWSPELLAAKTRAQKEYVHKCLELEKAGDRMLYQKKYKALADAARGEKEENEDRCTTRMRYLHNVYIAKTPREAKSSSPQSSPRSPKGQGGSQSARAARKVRRLPCALCEREFPAESLSGGFLRRTVERLRHQATGMPSRKGEAEKGTSTEGEKSAGADASTSLYDYEVRLCTSCKLFVSISSA